MTPEELEDLCRALELAHEVAYMDPRNAKMLTDAAAELRRLSEGVKKLSENKNLSTPSDEHFIYDELRARIAYARQLYEGEE